METIEKKKKNWKYLYFSQIMMTNHKIITKKKQKNMAV